MYFIVFLFIWIWHGCHDGESSKERETVCSAICEKVSGASLVWNGSCFLIWDGDILTEYALLGFVLLLFRKAKPKTLLIWAISLYLLFCIPFILSSFYQSNGQEWVQAVTQQAKQALHVYGSGSLKDIAEQRIHDRLVYMSSNGMLTYNPLNFFFASIPYFSMFLLGAAAAKSRYLHEPGKHRKGLKSVDGWASHRHQRPSAVQCNG